MTIKRRLEVNENIARKKAKRDENTKSTRKVRAREDGDIQVLAVRAALVVLQVHPVVLPVAQVPAQAAIATTKPEKIQSSRQSETVQRLKNFFYDLLYFNVKNKRKFD